MIVLSKEELKKLQRIDLEMLAEVDRICRKNNIEYSLDGGTLLGAVREKGFIPWDDDADIVFFRDQYELFYEACKKDMDHERFFLQEYRTDPQYPWGYSKMRRKGTVCIQEGQENLKFHNGVFIDIFVYDGVPDGKIARQLNLFECWLIRKCQYSVNGKTRAKSRIQRLTYSVMDKVPKSFLFKQIDRIADRMNSKPTELSRHITYPYPERCRYGLPRKCFNSFIDWPFEGYSFRIFSEYDLYLTLLYGDYMTPTPAAERVQYPISTLKLIDVDVRMKTDIKEEIV